MTHTPPPIKLFIATPCYGGNLHYQYVMSLLILIRYLKEMNIGYKISFLGNESLVTRARNIMVGKFLSDPKSTHLLFIDADIQFPLDNVVNLIKADKDVCFGVYPSKRIDFGRIKNLCEEGLAEQDAESLCLDYMLNFDYDKERRLVVDPHKKIVKVKYGTTGFMMIKKEVFVKMIQRYPHLQYQSEQTCRIHNIEQDKLYLFFDCMKDPETKEYLSEDYAFSLLWRKIGGDIWADLDSRLTHWGNFGFNGNLARYLTTSRLIPDDLL